MAGEPCSLNKGWPQSSARCSIPMNHSQRRNDETAGIRRMPFDPSAIRSAPPRAPTPPRLDRFRGDIGDPFVRRSSAGNHAVDPDPPFHPSTNPPPDPWRSNSNVGSNRVKRLFSTIFPLNRSYGVHRPFVIQALLQPYEEQLARRSVSGPNAPETVSQRKALALGKFRKTGESPPSFSGQRLPGKSPAADEHMVDLVARRKSAPLGLKRKNQSTGAPDVSADSAAKPERYPNKKPGRGRCPEVFRTSDGLPAGWTKVVCEGRAANCVNRHWVYLLAPDGREIRRKPQLDAYFVSRSCGEVDKLRLKFTLPPEFLSRLAGSGGDVDAVPSPCRELTRSNSSFADSELTRPAAVSGGSRDASPNTDVTVRHSSVGSSSGKPVRRDETTEVGGSARDRAEIVGTTSRCEDGEQLPTDDTQVGAPGAVAPSRNVLRTHGNSVLSSSDDSVAVREAAVVADSCPDRVEDLAVTVNSAPEGLSSEAEMESASASTGPAGVEASSSPAPAREEDSREKPPRIKELQVVVTRLDSNVFLEKYAEFLARDECSPRAKRRRVQTSSTSSSSLRRKPNLHTPVRRRKPSFSSVDADFELDIDGEDEDDVARYVDRVSLASSSGTSSTARRRRIERNKKGADLTQLDHEIVAESAEGLPDGWKKVVFKVRLSSGKEPLRTCFIAPDGSRFWVANRLQQYLKKKNVKYDPDVFSFARLRHERGAIPVDKMEELSHAEIHRTAEGLPPGWTKILFRLGKGPKKGHVRVCFLSPTGNRLWNMKDLEKYVRERGLDIDVKKQFQFKAGESLRAVKECPLVILEESRDGVPDGWIRVKYQRQDGKKSAGKMLYYFVTPAGKKLWSSTALKEYSRRHDSGLDLSQFHFSVQAVRVRRAWELKARGKRPLLIPTPVGRDREPDSPMFGKSEYREVYRTTEGAPEGWTKAVFQQGSGAGRKRLRPCFLTPDRRWIWNARHLEMYLKKHGDANVDESMFDFSTALAEAANTGDLKPS